MKVFLLGVGVELTKLIGGSLLGAGEPVGRLCNCDNYYYVIIRIIIMLL